MHCIFRDSVKNVRGKYLVLPSLVSHSTEIKIMENNRSIGIFQENYSDCPRLHSFWENHIYSLHTNFSWRDLSRGFWKVLEIPIDKWTPENCSCYLSKSTIVKVIINNLPTQNVLQFCKCNFLPKHISNNAKFKLRCMKPFAWE